MGQSNGTFGYALNTVAASGADVAAANGLVTFTGANTPFVYDNIFLPVVIQAYVAPVARVQTATFSAPAAVGEAYTIQVEQPQADGGVFKQGITIVSVTGSSTTTLAAAMATAMNGYISAGQIAGTATSSGAVLTTTGATTAPMLRLTACSGNIALAVSTAGNPVINSGTQLLYDYPSCDGLVATNNYTTVIFNYANNGSAINNEGGTITYVYAINEGDADYSTLVTKITEIFGGLVPGDTVANPEVIAKA
jgi:hypothetical protein